jgi:signal transduction histidine kinase
LPLGVKSKVALSVALLLMTAGLAQLLVTGFLIERETVRLREQLMKGGLHMLRASLGDGPLGDERMQAEAASFAPLTVATYDAAGRLLRATPAGADVPRALAPERLRAAAARPDDPAFLEPYSLGHDNVAILFVPGAKRIRYLALFDRWAPHLVNRALTQGIVGGFLLSMLIGLGATRAIAQRVGRRLERGEALVDRMIAGDFDHQLPDLGEDEVGRLAKKFNAMAIDLRRHVTQLRSEQESRRRAFADWSHEIATPLSSVLGYLESLEMEDIAADPALRRRYVETAYERALALKALTEDLATLSQLDFEGLPLHRLTFDLVALVATEIRALDKRIEASGLAVRVDAQPTSIWSEVDPQRLGQVVRNLLVNALRHGGAGTRVTVRLRTLGARASIEVEDEGDGIAPEHLMHLGERFYRVDSSRSRETGGRGLGLAIARGIVEAHGGSLTIRSVLGEGTIACVELDALAGGGIA